MRFIEQHTRLPLQQFKIEHAKKCIFGKYHVAGVELLVTDGNEVLALETDSDCLLHLGNRFLHCGCQCRHHDTHIAAAYAERAVDAKHAININVAVMKAVIGSFIVDVNKNEQRTRDADNEANEVDQGKERIAFEVIPAGTEVFEYHHFHPGSCACA